jgi:hypothetical protein
MDGTGVTKKSSEALGRMEALAARRKHQAVDDVERLLAGHTNVSVH